MSGDTRLISMLVTKTFKVANLGRLENCHDDLAMREQLIDSIHFQCQTVSGSVSSTIFAPFWLATEL